MDLKQLEQKHAELGAEIERLKAEQAVKSWPQIGDRYYTVGAFGNVNDYLFYDEEVDHKAKAIGNMFRTREEAESELEARKVVAELRSQPGRKKFVRDGNNFIMRITFDNVGLNIIKNLTTDIGWQSIYFESKEDGEAAIKTVGSERILAASKWWAMGELIK